MYDPNYTIRDLRIVQVSLVQPENQTDQCVKPLVQTLYMHESQVATFIAATILLHHTQGNPHHRNDDGSQKIVKTDNLWEITVTRLQHDTTYWWCKENLDYPKGSSSPAARINETDCVPTRLWAHPFLLEREKQDRLDQQRDEYEADMWELAEGSESEMSE